MGSEGRLVGITGATGEVGSRVARHMSNLGFRQRLVVRDPARAPQLPGAKVAQASSYGNAAEMRRALGGVHTLFLISAKESLARVQQHITAIDAAIAAGVERIIYLSFLSAAPDATFTFARDHFWIEQHVRSTGLPFTFLRPSLYLDRAVLWVGADGVIRGPAGNGRVARVSRDDIADVAVAVLTENDHDGRSYDVTGPVALTLSETAEQISIVTGRPTSYVPQAIEEARALRAASGAANWMVEAWVTSYAAIATGEMAAVSDTVSRLTGHEPQTLTDYLRQHPEAYHHLLDSGAQK